MIKTLRFIKQLLSIAQKNTLSHEDIINITSSVDAKIKEEFLKNLPNYVKDIQSRESSNENIIFRNPEEKKKYAKQLEKKIMYDFCGYFYQYIVYQRHFWENREEPFSLGIYDSEDKLKGLTDYFDKIEKTLTVMLHDLNDPNQCYYIPVDLTGDIKFETFNNRRVVLDNVGFESHYKYSRDEGGVNRLVFEKISSINNSAQPQIYAKNFSFLMLAAFYGCDHVIEILIKKGCDIHYKEPLSGKTALDFYRPIDGLNEVKRKYIMSLLDGSYENGYYQKLYNEKIRTQETPIKSVNEKELNSYGLYHSQLASIEQRIASLDKLQLSQEDKILLDQVLKTTFDKLSFKSKQEPLSLAEGKSVDPLLADTIDALYSKVEALQEKYNMSQRMQEYKETRIINKQLKAGV